MGKQIIRATKLPIYLITLTSTYPKGNCTLTGPRAHERHGQKMYVQKTLIKGCSFLVKLENVEGHLGLNIF